MDLYPIIFDIEIKGFGDNAKYLFGFDFPQENISVYFVWEQSGDVLYINIIRKFILELVQEMV